MQIYCELIQKVDVFSEDLIVIESWFQILGAATDKAYVPANIELSFRNKCLETDDLKGLRDSREMLQIN